MKNKSSNRGWSYFFRQRIHGRHPVKILELVGPDSELERNKGVNENILRWEDDGGPVLETGNPPLPQLAEIKTPRPMDVAGDDL